jgi:hypothetical protein
LLNVGGGFLIHAFDMENDRLWHVCVCA